MTRRISRFLPSRSETLSQVLARCTESMAASIGPNCSPSTNAIGQPLQFLRIDPAMHPHPVAPQPAGRRQFQLARQRAVIGQQQQPFGGEVQPADADHPRQARRQFLEHRRPPFRIFMRGHQPVGLVIAPQPGAFRLADRLAVDQHDVAGLHKHRRMRDRRIVQPHAPGGDHRFGIAPASIPARARYLAMRSPRARPQPQAAAMNAAKIAVSPASTRYSGCHCTPRQNFAPGPRCLRSPRPAPAR